MSHIEGVIDSLEGKVDKVLQRLEALKEANSKLQEELKISEFKKQEQEQEIASWKDKYDTLKMANTILGSDENKRETKLKINSLIREIDHCIAQLSD